VRGSIERHMDARSLALLKLAEDQEREGIKNLFGGTP